MIFGRQIGNRRSAPASTATPSAATCARNAALDKDQHIVLIVEIARVKLGRKDAVEPEFKLFQNPARPSRIHRAAVLVPQTDARAFEFDCAR